MHMMCFSDCGVLQTPHDAILALIHLGGPPVASPHPRPALPSHPLHRLGCTPNILSSSGNFLVSYFLQTSRVVNVLETTVFLFGLLIQDGI